MAKLAAITQLAAERREQGFELTERRPAEMPVVPTTAVDPVRGAPPHVLRRHVGHREVDGHLGAGALEVARRRRDLESGRVGARHLAEIDPGQGRIDGGHQLEIGILRRPPGRPRDPSGPRRRALPPAHGNPTGAVSPAARRSRLDQSPRVEGADHRQGAGLARPAWPPPRPRPRRSRHPPGPGPRRRPEPDRAAGGSTRSRLIRAPESSSDSSVSARRCPLATASSRSVMPCLPQMVQLTVDEVEHLAGVLGGCADVDRHRTDLVVVDPLGPDRVRQAPPLADLLEQATGDPAAEDVVEHGQCPAVLGVPARGRASPPPDGPARSGAGCTTRDCAGASGGTRVGVPPPARPAKRAFDLDASRSWSTIAGGRDHEVAGPVVSIEESADLGVRRGPTRWPGRRAPRGRADDRGTARAVHCSAARSAGSSACMRISSRITWRSASMSSGRSAGSVMMAPRTSSPRGRSSASRRM